ncbi:hypothetical protein [Geoalkalibacter halelectricus]|uniref:hypothetical protein n=1 Tax=Geoalkalibacter halelectricus TaxID=2847045 RepID=UPI00266FBF00|nr:hypothetical protein [Geoalkalibacter halelectricus]MDO3380358.1 hypothetical protein [Geoalkalibacter halelectricus]
MKAKVSVGFLMALAILLVASGQAFGFTGGLDPTDFFYTGYDLVVNRILNGPIGFIAGVAVIVWGATMIPRGQYLPAVGTLLAGGAILKADDIVNTMGMII